MNLDQALSTIRLIPDYPKTGVLFRDITPLLGQADAFAAVVSEMAQSIYPFQSVAGLEARGFIFASAIAQSTQRSFIPLRKAGKLPYKVHSESYGLEYGDAVLEVHQDAAGLGQNILLVDDVLATGGTALAGLRLIRTLGAICNEVAFVLEIEALGGREKLLEEFPNLKIRSLQIV